MGKIDDTVERLIEAIKLLARQGTEPATETPAPGDTDSTATTPDVKPGETVTKTKGTNSATTETPSTDPIPPQPSVETDPNWAATQDPTPTPSTTDSPEGINGGQAEGGNTAETDLVSSTIPTSFASETPTISPPESANTGTGVSSSSGVTTGALAGAVVGSIIGTALLSFLIAFILFRRRKPTPTPKSIDTESPSSGAGAYSGRFGSSPEKPDSFFAVSSIVPEPADDDTVRSKVLTLFDQAGLHIDNYYPPVAGVPDLSATDKERISLYDSEYLPAGLVTILGKRGVERQVLTHVLIKSLIEGIQTGGILLPSLFAAKPQIPGNAPDDALFAWRMLSSHLYKQANYTQEPENAAARNLAARSLAADFTAAFTPYSNANFPESDRLNHLTNLARATAELGVWLFQQPCAVEFDWRGSSEEPNVVPRVVKVADEKGKKLATVQVLVEGVTARL